MGGRGKGMGGPPIIRFFSKPPIKTLPPHPKNEVPPPPLPLQPEKQNPH